MGPLSRSRRSTLAVRQTKLPYQWPSGYDYSGAYAWQMTSYDSYAEEGYERNPVLHAALAFKCRAVSQSPLRAYSGDPDNPERLPADAPLAQLVSRPNPHQSWMEFQQQAVVYLNVAGNCYIFLDQPLGQETPRALYTLRPDRVKIIPQGTQVIGYAYCPERTSWADSIPILPQNLIHVKFPNPRDPYEGMGYGVSPFMPIARSGDVDNAASRFLYTFFRSGAVGLGALKFGNEVRLTDVDVANVRRRWRERYGGADNWAEPMVLDQGGEWQPMNPPFEEMGFEAIDARNETRMLGPFGVPPILIGTRAGLERSTFSNYREAETTFWQNTMIPELQLFEVDLDYYLAVGEAFVRYDTTKVPALQKDIVPIVDAFYKLFTAGVPRTIAAAVVGLEIEAHEFDDVSYLPFGTVLAEGLEAAAEAPAPETETEGEEEEPTNEGAPEPEETESRAKKAHPPRTGAVLGSGFLRRWRRSTNVGFPSTSKPPPNASSKTAATSRPS